MKKTVRWLLISCAFLFTSAMASDPFSTEPAPAQSFHTVQANPDSATAVPAAIPLTHSIPNKPNMTSAALDSGAAILNTDSSQSNANDNVDSAARIQSLVNDDQAMASAIRAINQNISVLQQQMLTLQAAPASNNTPLNWLLRLMQNPELITVMCFAAMFTLLLVSGVWIGKKMAKRAELNAVLSERRVKTDVLDDETKSEYDFMSSHEAIPAKLDLARAYIAMNDDEQARMVLTTVIEKGNQEQRSEALSLIQSMLKK